MSEYRKRNIAARLKALGFTQNTLAAEVGASRSFVGKLLRGERRSARLEPLLCEHLRLRRKRLYPRPMRTRAPLYFDHDGTLEPFPLCNGDKP